MSITMGLTAVERRALKLRVEKNLAQLDPVLSMPIQNSQDLKDAIHAATQFAPGNMKVRVAIIRRAKELGLTAMIPDHWWGEPEPLDLSWMRIESWDLGRLAATLPEELIPEELV